MKKKTEIKNIVDLTNDLKGLYEDARDGNVRLQDARDIANVAGKLIKSTAIQLDYLKFTNSKETIMFLETATEKITA